MLSFIIAGIISLIITSCIYSNGFISLGGAVAAFITFDIFFIIFFYYRKTYFEEK